MLGCVLGLSLGGLSVRIMATRKDQTEIAKWTSGYFDGDGSINVNIQNNEKSEINYNIGLACKIEQAYVGGFFDAEGSLSGGVGKDSHTKLGYSIDPQAVFGQIKNDGLKKYCLYLEQNDISYSHISQDRSGNSHPVEKVTIYRSEDVRAFLEGLLPHLTVKREQAKIMLEDILPIVERGNHTERRGFLKAMRHVDRMNEYKGGNRGKYNLEYFEDLWGMKHDG